MWIVHFHLPLPSSAVLRQSVGVSLAFYGSSFITVFEVSSCRSASTLTSPLPRNRSFPDVMSKLHGLRIVVSIASSYCSPEDGAVIIPFPLHRVKLCSFFPLVVLNYFSSYFWTIFLYQAWHLTEAMCCTFLFLFWSVIRFQQVSYSVAIHTIIARWLLLLSSGAVTVDWFSPFYPYLLRFTSNLLRTGLLPLSQPFNHPSEKLCLLCSSDHEKNDNNKLYKPYFERWLYATLVRVPFSSSHLSLLYSWWALGLDAFRLQASQSGFTLCNIALPPPFHRDQCLHPFYTALLI